MFKILNFINVNKQIFLSRSQKKWLKLIFLYFLGRNKIGNKVTLQGQKLLLIEAQHSLYQTTKIC